MGRQVRASASGRGTLGNSTGATGTTGTTIIVGTLGRAAAVRSPRAEKTGAAEKTTA